MKFDLNRTLLFSLAFTIAASVSTPAAAEEGPRRRHHSNHGFLQGVKTIFTNLGTKGNAKTTHYKMNSRKKQATGVGAAFKWKKKSICAAYGNP